MVLAGDLSDAERRVWDAFPAGESVNFGTGSTEDDDPAGGEDWGPDRQVRAEVLAALLCGAVEVEPGQVGKIFIGRARIIGKLNLPEATLKHSLWLAECYIADGIDLSRATTRSVVLQGCHVGAIAVYGAKINGLFSLKGAHLDGRGGPALDAAWLIVTESIFCDEGFQAVGEINLDGANIGGELSLHGAHLDGKGGRALRAERLSVSMGMFCGGGFRSDGEINLASANIGRELSLRGAHLDGKGGRALVAQDLTVTASMNCDEGFQADGEVNLFGARISGRLNLSGAHLDGKEGSALVAEGLTVSADMFCVGGFQARGEVDLYAARIGGLLAFRGAHLDGKEGPALLAEGLMVTANMFCDEGFQADGEVNLKSARIGGRLSFSRARLDGKGGPALSGQRLAVTQSMVCIGGFQARGEVNLSGASIGGQLAFFGAHLEGHDGPALTGQRLTVTESMFCGEGFQADAEINLVDAKIGTLADEKECWPQLLNLNGVTYGDLTYMPARERLDWLRRSVRLAGYSAQPYEQLAGYYRRLGHDEQARCVLLAKQRQRTRQHPWWARGWGWLQDALAGYGYAPGRALLLLAGAFVAGWLVFRARHPVPVGPGPYPTFNAALYTLDLLIPAPALGQADHFDPQGPWLAMAAGLRILGGLLAITVIAAITRSFSRT